MLVNFFQVRTELHNPYIYRKNTIIFNDLCIKEKINFMVQFERLLHTKFYPHTMYVIFCNKNSSHIYKFIKGRHLILKQNRAIWDCG